MPRFSSGTAQDDPICVDLTDNRRPPRRATIRVLPWPGAPGGSREKSTLELTTVEGTQAALQARLDEAGFGDYRLRQIHGLALEPHALYNLVDALIPAGKSPKRGGAAASSCSPAAHASWRVVPQVPPRQRRPVERIMLTVNPSFDLLAKVIAPEFTMAQGVKE
jgi:hypothetical protein